MWGIGSELAPSTSTSAVFGLRVKSEADHDRSRVEGTGYRWGDRDDAQGVAFVGAGQVDLAGDVGQRSADSRSGQGAADLGVGRAARAGQLFFAALWPCRLDRGVWAFAHPGQRAELSWGQDRGELGHVLFSVCSLQAHVEGTEGAGVVVDRARFEVRVEGRDASRGAGASAYSLGHLEARRAVTTSLGLAQGSAPL